VSFLRSFGAFWYDFIVGDSWELAAGVLGVLVVARAFDAALPGLADEVLYLLVPAGIVATLGVSLARAER
jgi:hypothetical protein